LSLASTLCFGFGLGHLTGFFGPGFWSSDAFGIVRTIRYVKPVYSIISLTPYCYGSIAAHHIVAGLIGVSIGLWQTTSRPGPSLYSLLSLANIEASLSSSIASVFFAGFITSGLVWYGSLSTSLELFGPTRFEWDTGYFSLNIKSRVKSIDGLLQKQAWESVPDKVVLYDYIGNNPAKGGLFRSGPMLKGDGIFQSWLGQASFEVGALPVSVRRMPAFFETFPVVLVDLGGTVRADIPFRRAESRYSLEQTKVIVSFLGGLLTGAEYSNPAIVKSYARKAQFGQIFTFDKKTSSSDGVFRTGLRGWYTFGHTPLGLLFFFAHLWHGGRSLFKEIWTGVIINYETTASVEYGRNEKLGERATKASAFI
jgi:photosystem II CP47 chlorophyll apoprotein